MLIVTNFKLLLFLEVKNWQIAKNKDSQSEKYPKVGAINLTYNTTFWLI